MPVARGDRPTQGTLELRSVKIQGADSWNDLATARTPEFLNSQLEGGRDFVEEPPTNAQLFFLHTSYMR
jgi:hypothetical protein